MRKALSKIGQFIAKNILLFIIWGVIFGTIGVSAAILMSANEVSYKNTTVKGALDDLYNKANSSTGNSKCGSVAKPVLKEGLIPVNIADDGTVTYANSESGWYNYCKKKWANARLLKK